MTVRPSHLFDKVEPVVKAIGYQLWWVHWIGRTTLQVFIDSPQGITLENCEQVSRELSAWLDLVDTELGLPASYSLQVSSPGAERKLYAEEHYRKFCGWPVVIRLHHARDGKRTFRVLLTGVNESGIATKTGAVHQSFDWSEIKETRLMYDPDQDLHRPNKENG